MVTKGLPASPGAATGQIVFHADDAEEWVARGDDVILVRIETSPEDIGGMNVAKGILTSRGGMTSHAAVVARGMGTCCVAGCGSLNIDYKTKEMVVGDKVFKEGDWISLDGSQGEVIDGKVPTVTPELSGNFAKLMSWADEFRSLNVRTNADTPHDSDVARKFGAEGIGLCLLFVLFIVGFSLSWYNKIITGIIFLLWNIGIWIITLYIVTEEFGFGIISGVPLLVLGVFFIISEYKTKGDPLPTERQQWKLALRLLLIIYTILYFITIPTNFMDRGIDLFNWPGVILIGLLPIYLIGFILSWKWELITGILFIIWYAGLFYLSIEGNLDPLKFSGFPVFLQGIFYLYYHFKLKPKQIQN